MRISSAPYKFGGIEEHDASTSLASDALISESNYNWNILGYETGTDGDATYSVEVSNDGNKWYLYAEEFTDVNMQDGVEDANALTFKFTRIVYNAGTNTAGTVKFELTRKYH